MDDTLEQIARDIDTLDNLAHALQMPLPPQMHVDALRRQLPQLVNEMRKHFVAHTHTDPWHI